MVVVVMLAALAALMIWIARRPLSDNAEDEPPWA